MGTFEADMFDHIKELKKQKINKYYNHFLTSTTFAKR